MLAPATPRRLASLLDHSVVRQELLLEVGNCVERILGRLLAGDGLVELLLLLDQQLEEGRHVPDVQLPVEARPEGAVPRTIGQVLRGRIDALEPALAAGLGEL